MTPLANGVANGLAKPFANGFANGTNGSKRMGTPKAPQFMKVTPSASYARMTRPAAGSFRASCLRGNRAARLRVKTEVDSLTTPPRGMIMYLETLSDLWPIPVPSTIEPLYSGINNQTFAVTCPGERYVLRICRPSVDLGRLEYELAVARRLAEQPLSFAVPAPLLARGGQAAASLEANDGGPRLAILVPLIPGTLPERADLGICGAIGRALGELTAALGRIGRIEPPPGVGNYGSPGQIHPAMPDPVAGAERLPLDPSTTLQLQRSLSQVLERAADLYRSLPLQQIHGDFVYPNLLAAGGRVTGVLDFEFTCRDLRPLDLISGLAGFLTAGLPEEQVWEAISRFCQGYAEHQPITPEEAAALPTLHLLRRTAVYANLAGRFLAGESPAEAMRYGVDSYLQAEEWLKRNGSRLTQTAIAAALPS